MSEFRGHGGEYDFSRGPAIQYSRVGEPETRTDLQGLTGEQLQARIAEKRAKIENARMDQSISAGAFRSLANFLNADIADDEAALRRLDATKRNGG